MAKELPYFQFFVSEWMNDDISYMSQSCKGVFIDVCSFYWFKDCTITKAQLQQRLIRSKKEISQLLDNQIIKETKDGYIKIKFLDEQYDMLSERRRKKQSAGAKGGKARLKQDSSTTKAELNHNSSNIEKKRGKQSKASDKKEYSPSEIEWMMGSPDGVRPSDHILLEDYIQLTGIPEEKINRALLYEFNDGTWIKYED